MWRGPMFQDYLQAALFEGEGFGSAYEYLVVERFRRAFSGHILRPRHIVVDGLPERYGIAADILLLADWCDASVTILDWDTSRIKTFKEVYAKMCDHGVFSTAHKTVDVHNLHWSRLDSMLSESTNDVDLIYSKEVFQTIPAEERAGYLESMVRTEKQVLLTVPNGDNPDHPTTSGLLGVDRNDLSRTVKAVAASRKYSMRWIDCPPASSGNRSRYRPLKPGSKVSIAERAISSALQLWATLEELVPDALKRRKAHIIALTIY